MNPMQKLILPINKSKLTASWQTTAYKNKYDFPHYGIDLICSSIIKDRKVWSSGNGTVVDCGYDNNCGNVVIVKYNDAYNHITNTTKNLVIRYFHLNNIAVKKNQSVTSNTILGEYGGTGVYGGGTFNKHLHIEVDYDFNHPRYTPTLKSSNWLVGVNQSGISKNAEQAMLSSMTNPVGIFHRKTDKPDCQEWTTVNDSFIRSEDKTIPTL